MVEPESTTQPESMVASESPLMKALPPQTDYLTYLTIIEYNLTKAELPLLHDILQDPTLTTNIGWDLVHILLPLLPESEQCLGDIARLGNPREVVLKVTELLEVIGNESGQSEDSDEEAGAGDEVSEEDDNGAQKTVSGMREDASREAVTKNGEPSAVSMQSQKNAPRVGQFSTLLHMLRVLHPRIKTKYPSRFLVTTFQAILPAYAALVEAPLATEAVLDLVRTLASPSKPPLPPRQSGEIPTVDTSYIAPDPEAHPEAVAPEESTLHKRLLCSFVTHIMEIYVSHLPAVGRSSGLAWTDRYQETLHPEKSVLGRQAFSSKFREETVLQQRDATVLQLMALAPSASIPPWTDLLHRFNNPVATISTLGKEFLPDSESSDSTFPFSQTGLLYLCTASIVYPCIGLHPKCIPGGNIGWQNSFMEDFIGFTETGGIGLENQQTIDCVLFLAFQALQNPDEPVPSDKIAFCQAMQQLSLLSANTPSPNLRYQAHIVSTAFLRANRDAQSRLGYIRDTLEHCPYENLKESAVSWFKGEVLEASKERSTSSDLEGRSDSELFSTPAALDSVFPFLFPAVSDTSNLESLEAQMPFYIAALNLYYLFCLSRQLYKGLDVLALSDRYRIDESFIKPLAVLAWRLQDVMKEANDTSPGSSAVVAALKLLESTVQQVQQVSKQAREYSA